MRDLPVQEDPRLLVGFDQADDAGVVALSEGLALVQTVDFMAPIVDDPETFGAIAAANALSDVYAMGGRPLSVLNVVAFPSKVLPSEVLASILRGALTKVREAGAVLAGGHSVKDDELKFGLAVTGLVDPTQVWTNGGAKPGDRLILTKPLGTGILATARKRDAIGPEAMDEATRSMSALNAAAAEAGAMGPVHACTVITGNGLVGHAAEVAWASGVRVELESRALPLLAGAREAAEAGMLPGAVNANRGYVGEALDVADGVDAALVALALDPQTSGGLLFSVPAGAADALLARLGASGVGAWEIGRVASGPAGVALL